MHQNATLCGNGLCFQMPSLSRVVKTCDYVVQQKVIKQSIISLLHENFTMHLHVQILRLHINSQRPTINQIFYEIHLYVKKLWLEQNQ